LRELIIEVVSIFDRLSIPYAICGSIASSAWGAFRTTNDADIIAGIAREHYETIAKRFPPPRFNLTDFVIKEQIETGNQLNIIDSETGMKVDIFIVPKDEWGENQLKNRKLINFIDKKLVYFCAAEDVIISKLVYYKIGGSEKHIKDISGIIDVSGKSLDKKYLVYWAKEKQVSEILEKIAKELKFDLLE